MLLGFTETILEYPFASTFLMFLTTSPESSIIFVGKYFDLLFPIPNWPYPLYPTAYAIPSSDKANVWIVPADTFLIFLRTPVPSLFFIFCGK